MTGEASFCGVPVLPFVGHLSLVDADGLPAGVAVFGKAVVEAGQAVGARLAHDVPLSAELARTLGTCEVLHVPRTTFRFRALVCQNDLGTKINWLKVKFLTNMKCSVSALQINIDCTGMWAMEFWANLIKNIYSGIKSF